VAFNLQMLYLLWYGNNEERKEDFKLRTGTIKMWLFVLSDTSSSSDDDDDDDDDDKSFW